MPKRWSVDLNGPRVVELEGLGNLTSYEAVRRQRAGRVCAPLTRRPRRWSQREL